MFLATAIFCWRLSTIYDFPPKLLTIPPSVGGSWQGLLGSRSSYSVNPCASKKSGPSLLSLDAQTHNPTLPAVVFAVARARLPPPSGRLARVHTGQRGGFVYFSGEVLDIERTCPTMHAYTLTLDEIHYSWYRPSCLLPRVSSQFAIEGPRLACDIRPPVVQVDLFTSVTCYVTCLVTCLTSLSVDSSINVSAASVLALCISSVYSHLRLRLLPPRTSCHLVRLHID